MSNTSLHITLDFGLTYEAKLRNIDFDYDNLTFSTSGEDMAVIPREFLSRPVQIEATEYKTGTMWDDNVIIRRFDCELGVDPFHDKRYRLLGNHLTRTIRNAA